MKVQLVEAPVNQYAGASHHRYLMLDKRYWSPKMPIVEKRRCILCRHLSLLIWMTKSTVVQQHLEEKRSLT